MGSSWPHRPHLTATDILLQSRVQQAENLEKFQGDKKEYGFQIHIASIWINLTDLNV